MRYDWWIIDVIVALLTTGLIYVLASYGLVTVTVSWNLIYIICYLSSAVSRIYRK